ncbi:MAG: type II secretion system protein [Hyphomicrobium sp.]|jgi:prepilin-type N-terminal cleavage/methylation domain-containing protein
MARRDGGFTLMEAVVALVVFASVAVALQNAFVRGTQGVRVADRETRALELGRTILTSAAPKAAPGVELHESGESDGYSWDMVISNYQPPEAEETPLPIQAYWVVVEVRWRDGLILRPRSLQLKTLKLKLAPQS